MEITKNTKKCLKNGRNQVGNPLPESVRPLSDSVPFEKSNHPMSVQGEPLRFTLLTPPPHRVNGVRSTLRGRKGVMVCI